MPEVRVQNIQDVIPHPADLHPHILGDAGTIPDDHLVGGAGDLGVSHPAGKQAPSLGDHGAPDGADRILQHRVLSQLVPFRGRHHPADGRPVPQVGGQVDFITHPSISSTARAAWARSFICVMTFSRPGSRDGIPVSVRPRWS